VGAELSNMITPLQANIPVLIHHFDSVVTLYVRQYGAGNLRIGFNKEDLINGVNLAPGQIVDGIPQAAADGVKQYFWSGDLWEISDVTGPVMNSAPGMSFYIDRSRGRRTAPSDVINESEEIGNLSTYR
jgi:hypothetical protein